MIGPIHNLHVGKGHKPWPALFTLRDALKLSLEEFLRDAVLVIIEDYPEIVEGATTLQGKVYTAVMQIFSKTAKFRWFELPVKLAYHPTALRLALVGDFDLVTLLDPVVGEFPWTSPVSSVVQPGPFLDRSLSLDLLTTETFAIMISHVLEGMSHLDEGGHLKGPKFRQHKAIVWDHYGKPEHNESNCTDGKQDPAFRPG